MKMQAMTTRDSAQKATSRGKRATQLPVRASAMAGGPIVTVTPVVDPLSADAAVGLGAFDPDGVFDSDKFSPGIRGGIAA